MGFFRVFRRLTAACWKQFTFRQQTTNLKRARKIAKLRSNLIFAPSAYRPPPKLEKPKPIKMLGGLPDEGPDSLVSRQFRPLPKSPEVAPLPPKPSPPTMQPVVVSQADFNQDLLLRDPTLMLSVESKLRNGQRFHIARKGLGNGEEKGEIIQVWYLQGYFWTQIGKECFRELDLRLLLKSLPS